MRIHRARDAARQRKALLCLALAGNLGVLGYFKYYDFFVSSTHNMVGDRRARPPARRCGRSCCRSASPSSRSWRSATSSTPTAASFEPATLEKFAVYLSFFPHLVAGPIVRPRRADPAARDAARPAPRRHEPRLLPDRDRPLQEGRDRELPRVAHRRPGLRRRRTALVARDPGRASTPTPSRSTPTSPATPTSRSASRCCSASRSRRTSTRRTRPSRSRTSGGAGT